MNQQRVMSPPTRATFARLADLLEQASHLARQLSQGRVSSLSPTMPKLRRPKRVPKDQAWFWTQEWQAGERAVDEALARGEYQDFDSVEDLIADLHAHV